MRHDVKRIYSSLMNIYRFENSMQKYSVRIANAQRAIMGAYLTKTIGHYLHF